MHSQLRALFAPILDMFEKQPGEFVYKPSHRLILKVVGLLFWVLSATAAVLSFISGQLGGVLPALIFFAIGFVCQVVGFLGTDRAVAKMWKSR